MTDATALPASPLHALCVYAEPLVVGRRVVVFGDPRGRLGERFLDLGARVVHVYDPEPTRAAAAAGRAPRGVSVFPLPSGEFDVRDGAFDVAIIADAAEIPAPAALLGRVRRLLSPGGTVLVRSAGARGSANAPASSGSGALDYYELYDLVALQFAHVRMVGQLAWTGVGLVELGRGEGEPDVTVDTQLVPEAAPPEAFIAVGSQEETHLAEYALIQLPPAAGVDVEAAIAHGSERADLAAAQLRASLLEAQVEELRGRRNSEGAAHADVVTALEAELASRLTELQAADERSAQTSARAERAVAELRARDEDLARLRDRATLALKELEDERRLRARAENAVLATQRAAEIALIASQQQAESAIQANQRTADAGANDRATLERVTQEARALEGVALTLEARLVQVSATLAASEEARARVEAALEDALVEIETLRALAASAVAEAPDPAFERDDAADPTDALLVAAASRIAELEQQTRALTQELAGHGEGHATELAAFETALRERGQATHALERELERRERIVIDLVHALEETRADAVREAAGDDAFTGASRVADDARRDLELEPAVREAIRRGEQARAENVELRAKLDAAALDIARREGEATASAWRLEELEQAVARLEDEQSELTMTIPPPAVVSLEREVNDVTKLTSRLTAALDERDLLRQALAQEHQARSRAESGEALAQAKAELARQAALLEKLSRELETHDGVRRSANDGHGDGHEGGGADPDDSTAGTTV